MNLREAWDATPHGGTLRAGEFSIQKWMADKPGMPSGLDRFLIENNVPSDAMFSSEWVVE